MNAGPLLAPPAGAFVLADTPVAGASTIVVAAIDGADTVDVAVFDGTTTWHIVSPQRGSIALPSYVDPLVLAGTKVLRLDGASLSSSAYASIDDLASAVATSP